MRFTRTRLEGVVIVDVEPHSDARGSFTRTFDRDRFAAEGLFNDVVDVNLSHNPVALTLRGLHFQDQPHPDPKLVRCSRGLIFDVALDLRPTSGTYLEWTGHMLDAKSGSSLHIPAGCAHGFLTLEADTEVHYLMGAGYVPELARGVRWNDPAFGIEWPADPAIISERDAACPDHAR